MSRAPGNEVASASSQSVSSATAPSGWEHSQVGEPASPYPSASASTYQAATSTASASSTTPSQSSSAPSQYSSAPGNVALSLSSQSLSSLRNPGAGVHPDQEAVPSPKPSASVSA